MSVDVTHPDAIEQYLQRLRHALKRARTQDRDDYVDQISEHLNETRVAEDSLDTLIRRVGSPETLAREFYVAERAKLGTPARLRRWLRRWWVGLLSLIVILVLIPGDLWANSFQPLSTQLNGEYNDKVVTINGSPPKKLVGGFSAPITWELTNGRYRVTILFDASNMNSLTVDVSPPGITNGFPNPVKWYLESSKGALTPFVSADVKGGQYQEILFSETYVCSRWPKGNPNSNSTSSTFITNLPIVESYLGFQHTVELAIQPFYLEFAGNCFNLTK
jgi:hypothetical protein